ncbi:hypothetical protein F5Y15DRAFT_1701 [Xylariaceae sp. FL0016]|nr:hypothetical protein F5Y15DRAFT_1701 [Xylariaceae sp. FL0016]
MKTKESRWVVWHWVVVFLGYLHICMVLMLMRRGREPWPWGNETKRCGSSLWAEPRQPGIIGDYSQLPWPCSAPSWQLFWIAYLTDRPDVGTACGYTYISLLLAPNAGGPLLHTYIPAPALPGYRVGHERHNRAMNALYTLKPASLAVPRWYVYVFVVRYGNRHRLHPRRGQDPVVMMGGKISSAGPPIQRGPFNSDRSDAAGRGRSPKRGTGPRGHGRLASGHARLVGIFAGLARGKDLACAR